LKTKSKWDLPNKRDSPLLIRKFRVERWLKINLDSSLNQR